MKWDQMDKGSGEDEEGAASRAMGHKKWPIETKTYRRRRKWLDSAPKGSRVTDKSRREIVYDEMFTTVSFVLP